MSSTSLFLSGCDLVDASIANSSSGDPLQLSAPSRESAPAPSAPQAGSEELAKELAAAVNTPLPRGTIECRSRTGQVYLKDTVIAELDVVGRAVIPSISGIYHYQSAKTRKSVQVPAEDCLVQIDPS